MDSQGYVPLHFIERIVPLARDIDLIRRVCGRSQYIEFQPGPVWQDGRDRIRAREIWHHFVLPVAQRDPSTQHPGSVTMSKLHVTEPVLFLCLITNI